MKLSSGGRSDPGRRRSNNEDAFFHDPGKGFFVVADGLGGHAAGEVASGIAVEMIREELLSLPPGRLTPDPLCQAVAAANRAIYLKSLTAPELDKMGTTVVAAVIREEKLLLAHVGDSRAYLAGAWGWQRLTADHSLMFKMIQEGQLTETEARSHPARGVILRSLGAEESVTVDSQELPYQGELLLLCSDGLTDMLTDQEIATLALSRFHPQEICDLLIEAANQAGGYDNITVVAVRGII